MARTPAKRAKKTAPARKASPVNKASPVKLAVKQVAVDADQVRVDLDKLLKSLEGLGVVALREVAQRATVLIDERTEGEKRSFIEEVTARAQALGMSLADIVAKAMPESVRPVSIGGKPAKSGDKRASPIVKYRSPSGQTWTGRGRTPQWLVSLEAEGKKREDFAV
jgi:DNA-binding protein H-NS